MKVLIVVDKYGSAIHRLAEQVRMNNPHLEIIVYPVHPKRNDVETLVEAQRLINWCDILDIHYWKSGEILKTSFPVEFDRKPKVLFHFNPYDLEKEDWQKDYKKIVVGNERMQLKLPYSDLIPYGVDLSFFEFNENYTEDKIVQMSVARIEGKKGVLEVARVCKELDYKFILIGRVSEPNYMAEIMREGSVDFRESADEQGLLQSYREAAIHVCNSVDDFESGTLPIIEAMACGVPVLTRNIGHVPDLFNGENMIVRKGVKDDFEDLKSELSKMMESREQRIKIRGKAWETVKNRDVRKMARQVSDLYYLLWKDNRPLVSIIIPTYDRPEALIESLVASTSSDYGKIEVVVADSGHNSVLPIIEKLRKSVDIPVKYVRFQSKGYTLAEARNRAVLEAQGEILIFCDDRLVMEPNAVSKFAERSNNKF